MEDEREEEDEGEEAAGHQEPVPSKDYVQSHFVGLLVAIGCQCRPSKR